LLDGFQNEAAFPETARTDEREVVLAVHHSADVLQLLLSVGEKLLLNDRSEFKWILHCEIFRCEIFRKDIGLFPNQQNVFAFYLPAKPYFYHFVGNYNFFIYP